jgi:hypothetical protein
MSDSELIPELENIVSEYTDSDDYKKLMIYNPKLYTDKRFRSKLISNIPTDSLIRFSEMYNLAVSYNLYGPQPIYLSPEFLSGIFIKYYSNIKNSGLNPDSIISNPDIRHEMQTHIESIYNFLLNTFFDIPIIVIDEIEIDLYLEIFQKIERYFLSNNNSEIDTDFLTDLFNDYYSEGINDFLQNPKVYIDTIIENKSQFYIWIYDYMNSKIEKIIERLSE